MNPQSEATAEGILYTDEYQLTMAQVYFRLGLHETPAQFDHFFRHYPDYGDHQAGYCINAGLEWLLDWMRQARVRPADLDHLRGQRDRAGRPIFDQPFLRWLGEYGNFDALSLAAIPEGRVVHPNEPLSVVRGPLAMAQILETALLNLLNYQTLIATKASRIHDVARGGTVLEFGMRRGHAQGVNAGGRAALIGGAHFSSNVGLSHVLGYPPKGTHAHSLVQAFMALGEGELGAFRAYAEVFPDDCLLLVDTISTLESGVPNAIRVFEELRAGGHVPVGIRLDSGDLAYLSIQAAKQLDAAGFENTSIVLSNNLDELIIWQIITQIQEEAPQYGVDADRLIKRLVYGVGTGLITSRGASALDGVYKLVAIQQRGAWLPAIKVSETPEKTLNPGHKRVWRLYDQRGKATTDLLGLSTETPDLMDPVVLHHPVNHTRYRNLRRADLSAVEPLLVDILVAGQLVYDLPDIEAMRAARLADLERLDPGVKRLVNPHIYHVSLSEQLWNLKQSLAQAAQQSRPGALAQDGHPAA
ncbi:MAG: nicotinate phosphoribosyltransferase [Anaerolineales bacterium]|nr:nicotinate phosphoribosyltransferase [Anaerolineales bacterium]